jgi:transposase-like protein
VAEDGAAASVGIIEAQEKRATCPHCGSERVVRNGSASDLQRYKCRICSRTFNTLTGTPLARLRQKSKWIAQAEVLRDGMTIMQAE